MSDEQAGIPFRKVLDLCGRHGFQLMRIVDGVRVFWNPGSFDPADPRTWVAVEVSTDHCVTIPVFCRLQEFFQDYCDQARFELPNPPEDKTADTT